MESVWLWAYLVVGTAALVQSLLLVLQTWEHRRYTRSCLRRAAERRAQGRAVVIVPCKGVDVGLEDNLRALWAQDYPDYELRFVVEQADDPACEVIERLSSEPGHPPGRLIVAGKATDCGQKVHNLRAATAELSPRVEFLAFVDSDAQPRPWWLRAMLARLTSEHAGAVTGYRWFLPQRNTLPNLLVYAANCGTAVLLGRRSHGLVWGGSWAVRRETFEELQIHRAWKGTLSDDLLASRQFRLARMPVWFEPACVVGSPLDCTWGEMFAFVRRQYQMMRLYARRWWLLGVAANGLTNLAWLATAAALVFGAFSGGSMLRWALGMGLALYGTNVWRAYLRQDVAGLHFPELRDSLRPARWFDIWLGPLASLLIGWGLLSSAWGRTVGWRGIRYVLGRRGRVLRIDPAAQSHAQRPMQRSRTARPIEEEAHRPFKVSE